MRPLTRRLVIATTAVAALLAPVVPAGAAYPDGVVPISMDADRAPLSGDLDGDGRGDLLWYSGRPGIDAIWFGGTDRNAQVVPLGVGPGFEPVLADTNGDGFDDIFWYRPDGGGGAPAPVWFGGRSRTSWRTGLATAPPAAARAIVADLDGNGTDDVFWYTGARRADAIYFGRSDGAFLRTGGAVGFDYATAVGDFDGNGADDIVWYAPDTGGGAIWWGGPGGLVGSPLGVGSGFVVRAGDFNGDRIDDLLWFQRGAGTDAIWYGRGGRAFAGALIPAGGDHTPFVADVDGNGWDDIFWQRSSGGASGDVIWFNQPGGTFGFDPGGAPAGTPVVVDLDGDRSDDVLFFQAGAAVDTWWFGQSARPRTPNLTVTTLVSGLTNPWQAAPTPDGALLFTERPGRLSVRLANGTVRQLSADFSDLYVSGENGLLGLAVDPAFSFNRRIYTCQAVTGPSVEVIAWQVDTNYTAAVRVIDPLVGGMPASASRHGGCRLEFDATGALLVGTGDATVGTAPQDLTSLGGKVLRVDPVRGEGVFGNPFLNSPNANTRKIVSYGHRNVQGLAVQPGSGRIYEVEHGTDRDDEINALVAGGNYGWNPVPGYDESKPMTAAGGIAAQWSSGFPTIAPSGATFLVGRAWGTWEGALAVATLKNRTLRIFFLDANGALVDQVIPTELSGTYGRLRSVTRGPAGTIYVTTDNGGGNDRILQITAS